MLRWFLNRRIAAFEKTWDYDAGYLHELIDADPGAMLAFGKLQAISRYRRDAPPAAYAAAGIVAVMAEDCGPCTQLGIDMAERGGVDPAVLRAIVARDDKAMPDEVALAVRFAEATLRRAPEADQPARTRRLPPLRPGPPPSMALQASSCARMTDRSTPWPSNTTTAALSQSI